MQPEITQQQIGPEGLPPVERVKNPNRQENLPDKKAESESGLKSGAERNEMLTEARAATADASSSGGILPPVVNIGDDTTSVDPVVVSDDSPMVAADEDLIEKEWVDKAKRVIGETKHDPHQQEEKVSKLQSDYLKKRYGREINPAN